MTKAIKLTPKNLVKEYAKHGSLKKVHKAHPEWPWKSGVLATYHQAVAEGLIQPLRVGNKTSE